MSEDEVVGFLYHMAGPQAGDIVKLYEGRNTIGTSEECNLRLVDPSVSAKHASMRCEDETNTLRDLDSQTGTFVNGDEIITHELTENDVIDVGDTKLKFKTL
jgi:pSer/pThr/pTyr-binding forkhead associated (FHA) protein